MLLFDFFCIETENVIRVNLHNVKILNNSEVLENKINIGEILFDIDYNVKLTMINNDILIIPSNENINIKYQFEILNKFDKNYEHNGLSFNITNDDYIDIVPYHNNDNYSLLFLLKDEYTNMKRKIANIPEFQKKVKDLENEVTTLKIKNFLLNEENKKISLNNIEKFNKLKTENEKLLEDFNKCQNEINEIKFDKNNLLGEIKLNKEELKRIVQEHKDYTKRLTIENDDKIRRLLNEYNERLRKLNDMNFP